MLGVGVCSMSLPRPCSLHAHASRPLTTRRCLASAPKRASTSSSSTSSSSTSMLYSSTSSSSSRSDSFAGGSKRTTFGRTMEIDKLRSLQCQVPAGFTVVTGPRNSGKTALLKDVFAHQADAVYVDCRTLDRGNPASLTKALLAELAAKAPASAVQQAAEVCGKFAAVAADMEMQVKWDGSSYTTSEIAQAFLTFQAHQQDLGDVFKALGLLIAALGENKAADTRPSWPVLVIDEANLLMDWKRSHPGYVDSILGYLVAISKQDNACHVILATSQYYAFRAWLWQGIGPRIWLPKVIGDFPEAAARQFLEHKLAKHGGGSKLDDAAWRKVFQVCGGNAGDLMRLVGQVADQGGDWDAALEDLWAVELDRTDNMAMGGDGWTAEQYADIALKLLDSEHHALPLREALMVLGQHTGATTPATQKRAGAAALQHLVAAHALYVRPESSWASDIPEEAFGAAGVALVTAASPLDLYCMGRLRGELEATLKW